MDLQNLSLKLHIVKNSSPKEQQGPIRILLFYSSTSEFTLENWLCFVSRIMHSHLTEMGQLVLRILLLKYVLMWRYRPIWNLCHFFSNILIITVWQMTCFTVNYTDKLCQTSVTQEAVCNGEEICICQEIVEDVFRGENEKK